MSEWVSNPLVQIYSKHCQYQTERARELKFWENVLPTLCVTCLQKAAPSTSHQLSKSQVVLNKRIEVRNRWLSHFILWDLLQVEFLNFITIWFVKCGHNLSCWVWSQFELLSCQYLSLRNWSSWVLTYWFVKKFKF